MSQWTKQGLSNKECAKRLGRNKSTIGRELTRNQTRVGVGKGDWEIIYEPQHAQAVATKRKQKAFDSKQPLKNKKIYSYVLDHLKDGWSPEQISGRLKYVDHQGDRSWHICHETIYQFIYKPKTDKTRAGLKQECILNRKLEAKKQYITVTDHEKPLWEYLRRKQVRRRKRPGRKVQRVRIPDRISIHNRPTVVERRKQFGHWEGDSIVGLGHTSGLHTQYERVSSLTRLEMLNRITSDQSVLAYEKIFGPLPDCARRTVTFDNGSEHVRHGELKRRWGMSTYFADPYASWQRGGNENANLWIRYYFPKGTDFNLISDEELKDVEWELNWSAPLFWYR